jgi:hypothetical protein
MKQGQFLAWVLPVWGVLIATPLVSACSANDGASTIRSSAVVPPGSEGTAASTGNGGSVALPPGAGAVSPNGGVPLLVVPTTGGTGQGGGGGDGCPAIRQKPEQVVTYKPVALFIMQDRTGSMVTGFPSGCA